MPFFGPYNLGGTAPNAATERLRQQFPGIQSMTSYPGQGGVGTASLGFTHPGPLLFQGQPPSTLDALLASPPRLVEGVNVQPESITGALSGGTTPTLGIARSDSIGGVGDVGAGGVAAPSVSAPGVSAPTASAAPSNPGMTSFSFTQTANDINNASPVSSLTGQFGLGVVGALTNTPLNTINTAIGAFRNFNSPNPRVIGGPINLNAPIDLNQEIDEALPDISPDINIPTGPVARISDPHGLNEPDEEGIPGLTNLNTAPDPDTEGPAPAPGLTDLNTMPDPDTGGGGPGDGK